MTALNPRLVDNTVLPGAEGGMMFCRQLLAPVLFLLGLVAVHVHADQAESPIACPEGPPIPIAYGEHTSGCDLGTAADLDFFTFSGVSGEFVSVRVHALGNHMDPMLEIFDPMGVLVHAESCSGICSFGEDFVLGATGTYTLRVSEASVNESGSYELALDRVPPVAAAPQLPYGATESDTLSHPIDADFFAFEGVSGSTVRITVTSFGGHSDPIMQLLDPVGTVLDSGSCSGVCSFFRDVAITSSGNHLLWLTEAGANESGTYTVTVQCLFGNCFGINSVRQYIDSSNLSYLSPDDAALLHLHRTSDASATLVETSRVLIKDTATNSTLRNMYFFSKAWRPIDLVTLDNNGVDVLSVLAVNKSSGNVKVRTKDPASGADLNTFLAFGPNWDPISLTTLPDRSADSVSEIGVVARNRNSGIVRLRTYDPLTGVLIDETQLPAQ